MSPTHGLGAQHTDRKEGSIMAAESTVEITRPADVGLRRELGLIGATWASETSIIGSGWLFAPQEALQVAYFLIQIMAVLRLAFRHAARA